MSSIRRPNDERYVHRTIESILAEASGQRALVFVDTVIAVFHPRVASGKAPHEAFEELVQDNSPVVDQWKSTFFPERKDRTSGPSVTLDLFEADNWSEKVAKQTSGWSKGVLWRKMYPRDVQHNMDIVALLSQIQSRHCRSSNRPSVVMIMEDDFEWCPSTMQHLHRVLKLFQNRESAPSAVRVSYGLNGILISCDKLPFYISFLEENMYYGPADWLLSAFYHARNRDGKFAFNPGNLPQPQHKYHIYRFNLMEHIRHESIINPHRGRTYFPNCFDKVVGTGLHPEDEFYRDTEEDFLPPALESYNNNGETYSVAFPYARELSIKRPFNKIVLRKGDRGESCTDVCSREGDHARCIGDMLPLINNCGILKREFGCSECSLFDHIYLVREQDSPHLRNPARIAGKSACVVSSMPRQLHCDGSHKDFERLCPCVL